MNRSNDEQAERPVATPLGQTRLSGLRLGRMGGVEVMIDWSLIVIFLLLAFSLGWQMLPSWHPGWSPLLRWSVAVLAALAFFGSVLAHEMSHALVGNRLGVTVRRITLFLFGGMAHMENEPPSPQSELLMAVVGPLTSLLIGITATLAATLSMGPETMQLFRDDPTAALHLLGAGQTVLLWLGPVNVVLAIFNMVPGFPLDGGRVFRALAWWATGDLEKATRWASGAGKLIAIALMACGVLMALGFQVPWFGRGFGPGLWLLLIGWFLFKAAQASYLQLLIREAIEGIHVTDLMRHRFQAVPPNCDVRTLVHDYAMRSEQESFPVVAEGRLLGMVRVRDAMRVAHDRWSSTPVEQVMTPAADVDTVAPQAELRDALHSLQRKQLSQLAVVEDGNLRGLLRTADIFRWVALHQLEQDGSTT